MNYVYVLSLKYPHVFFECTEDENNYNNIKWVDGDPLPSRAELEAAYLDAIQIDSWKLIKNLRNCKKTGGVKVGIHWFHSDDPSRIQQIALVMFGANIPPNLMWKTMTGEFVLMTQSLAADIFETSAISDQIIFAKAEYHRDKMLLSDNPATYDFSLGWPLTFVESPEYVAN